MLTVKHIRFDGAESIDYCQRVLFNPSVNRGQLDTPCPHWDGWVSLIDAIRGRNIDYDSGIVYVMNEAGSTISKYDLGNNPRPTQPVAP